jgi:hypothetical protein
MDRQHLINLATEIAHSEAKERSEGVILVGPLRNIGPGARLFTLFSPTSADLVREFEESFGIRFPEQYGHFLTKVANGAFLYNGSLSVFGIRGSRRRSSPASLWIPHDLWHPNTTERPTWAATGDLIIGAYRDNGARVVTNASDGEVRCQAKKSGDLLASWKTFEEFLLTEIERLSSAFGPDWLGVFSPNVTFSPGSQRGGG